MEKDLAMKILGLNSVPSVEEALSSYRRLSNPLYAELLDCPPEQVERLKKEIEKLQVTFKTLFPDYELPSLQRPIPESSRRGQVVWIAGLAVFALFLSMFMTSNSKHKENNGHVESVVSDSLAMNKLEATQDSTKPTPTQIKPPPKEENRSAEDYYRDGMEAFSAKRDREARNNFLEAANLGHIKAQYCLAEMYLFGYGGPKRPNKAIELFRILVDQPEEKFDTPTDKIRSLFYLGQLYHNKAKETGREEYYREAARCYGRAAQQNNSAALCNLGVLYRFGLGMEKDSRKAEELFLKAAEFGSAMAQRHLGTMYSEGEGDVPANFVRSRYFFEKAAAQGDTVAIRHLRELEWD